MNDERDPDLPDAAPVSPPGAEALAPVLAGTSAADHFAAVRTYLDEQGWQYTQTEGQTVLWADFTSTHGGWRVYFAVAEDGVVSIDSVLAQRVPAEHGTEMARLLTMANYGMRIGAFQLDLADGELRFHTAVDVELSMLSAAMVQNLVVANLATMDRYYRAILAVLVGTHSAEQAHELAVNATAD